MIKFDNTKLSRKWSLKTEMKINSSLIQCASSHQQIKRLTQTEMTHPKYNKVYIDIYHNLLPYYWCSGLNITQNKV